jgi:hypothetical protein
VKEDSSFLKKRSKKLLLILDGTGGSLFAGWLRAMGKSFLLLFFKKEDSSL